MFGKKSSSSSSGLFASSPVLGRKTTAAAVVCAATNLLGGQRPSKRPDRHRQKPPKPANGNGKQHIVGQEEKQKHQLDEGEEEEEEELQQKQQQQRQHHLRVTGEEIGRNGLAIDRRSLRKLRKQLQRMSTEELEMFSSGDDFVLDCLLDRAQAIKRVQQERDDLKKQVSTLAKFNYAREPEFVRDRTKLRELSDEVAGLIRHATSRHVEPTVSKLNSVLAKLTNDAIKYEELSESMAQDFLLGKTSYDEFIDQYVNLRKETSRKRVSVDKLTKEKASLAANHVITAKLLTAGTFGADSPVPTPRQRKRVSFNK